MSRSFVARAAALLLAGAALAAHAAPLINQSRFSHLAVDGYDVVAYQTEQRAVEGKAEFQTRWHDAHWRFASAAHLAAFKADPERYAPQYGGYCAYAVGAKNELVDIDPEAFTVVDGKLYLNYSPKIRAQWDADRARYIEAADRNWPALSQRH
ncbi:YHS domain-containing (seleno)protein [Solimonas variicoloris]|uniref:YHS domain-containing (seleno)protein n=1 Tax=Solimonas variicoloris TaxID=254408 RepID=UPI00035D6204|nr:YHS domain-containing (seleno)protein [Solimonas variicoloris]